MANRTDTDAVIRLVINGEQANASLRELTDTQRRLNSELRNMRPSDPGYARIEQELQAVTRATTELRRQQQGLNNEAGVFQGLWKNIAGGILGADIIQSGIGMITSAVVKMKDALAEAGANRAVLTNALGGDAKAANTALKMLMDFAAKTPEGLQQATDGFLKLVNRGIKPAREELVNIGDVAASQKKSMDQYIEAIMDAQTGENERLKEFGIRAQKNGDTVSFTFKGITKEVKNTEDAIYKALLAFGDMDGVKGTMDVVSKELVGVQSNIEDSWDQIYTKLGQKSEGFIYGFYNTYSKILSWVNDDLLSTESEAEKLTSQFKEQAISVNHLEKNINPLLDRYDQLKAKGKLNKEEQGELKNILNQVAATIPGAITQWDKYGNALDLNAGKAREFIKIQQVMLRAQNKEAVDAAQKEIGIYTKLRDDNLKKLNAGETTTMGGNGYEFTFKNTDKQIVAYRKDVAKYNDLIEDRRLLVKGLNGNFMDEVKPPAEVASTARTEGVINAQIKALKEDLKDLDVHSKEYASKIAQIKVLSEELSGAKGKPSSGETEANKEKKAAITEFEKLNEGYNKLGVEQLDAQLSKNQKEIEQEGRKYDTLLQQKRDFLKQAGTTTAQKDITQVHIDQLEADKKTALTNMAIRQEEDMVQKIGDLRSQLAKRHETELGKEIITINKFYDDQEKAFLGNGPALAQLRLAREKDLTDASIREKERLEKEKQNIEAQYQGLIGDKDAMELAGIHKKYDDQIQALKEKFIKEGQLTAEHQAVIDAINRNREAETEAFTKEKEDAKRAQIKDAAIQSAQAVSDAVFSIAANNRQRETDLKLSALDKEREQELSRKGLTEKQKEAINKKYAEKEKEIKLQAWKADKSASITQAIINGALAVTKALPNIPLAIATGITAGAQLAVIMKQPTPEFGGGVQNFKGGPAIVGEKGPEIVDENGKLWLADKATLAELEPGTDVYTAAQTASMMQGNLRDNLYKTASYSLDVDGARNAERQYRSNSSPLPVFNSSPEITAPSTRGSDREQEIIDLKNVLATFIKKQEGVNELPVVLYHGYKEDFERTVKEVKMAQSG